LAQQSSADLFHFQRSDRTGIVLVLNHNSYVMAEYRERTGQIAWQRQLTVQQRDAIEKRLQERFPTPRRKVGAEQKPPKAMAKAV
jgi:hypothetical protein